MNVTIWHNPRCSKSRATLALLRERGIEPEIRLYLTDPPTPAELRAALDLMGRHAADLVRRREAREAGIDPHTPEPALIAALAANPAVIERPVVFANERAALGRPPEAVLAIL